MKNHLILVVLCLTMAMPLGASANALTGDVNADGVRNIEDVTTLIDYLLSNDASLINLENADIDNDHVISVADVTEMIDLLLNLQPPTITDGVEYDVINGIGIKNLWIQDREHSPEIWTNQPYCNTNARTAVLNDGFIYIARSNANVVVVGTDTLTQSVIYKVDATNGELIETLPLTLNGEIYGGAVLSANSIGVDNFGHLYLTSYTSAIAIEWPIYLVDKESGEMSLVASLDKGEVICRCDYIDVMGDLTREQAECNIMAAGASSEYIYRWHADQGSDFEGGFNGDPYLAIEDFYPKTVANWGYMPIVKMIEQPSNKESRYSGEQFFVDGYYTAPAIYNKSGNLIESFENVYPELHPWDVGANGVCEFKFGGRTFVAYVLAQYLGYDVYSGHNRACQVNICELGEGNTLGNMQHCWMVPDALGTITDGGTRIECINAEHGYDQYGNEEITLFIYKCYNGMAVYKIGPNVQ